MKPLVSVSIALAVAGLPGAAIAQVTQAYSYDGNGRLTGVSTTASGETNTAAYAYDDADNRTLRSQTGSTTWAALSRLPVDQELQPHQALVSTDGRFSLALRASGRVEVESTETGRGAGSPLLATFFRIDGGGAARFRPEADFADQDAFLTLTGTGELMLLSGLSDGTVLWRSRTAVAEAF